MCLKDRPSSWKMLSPMLQRMAAMTLRSADARACLTYTIQESQVMAEEAEDLMEVKAVMAAAEEAEVANPPMEVEVKATAVEEVQVLAPEAEVADQTKMPLSLSATSPTLATRER